MKRILFSLFFCCFCIFSAYATDDVIRYIHREGGKYAWYDIFHLGEVTYRLVETRKTEDRNYLIDPTGEYHYREAYTLWCEGEGPNPCRWTGSNILSLLRYRGIDVSDEFLSSNIDVLLDEIDQELLENGTPNGMKSKKLLITQNGQSVILLLKLVWTNGNKQGDVDIDVHLEDITDYVGLIN